MRHLRRVVHLPLLFVVGCIPDCDGDYENVQEMDQDGDGYVGYDDCDDHNASANPGEVEWCNGFDDDCDGSTDIDARDATSSHPDEDGDGFGDSEIVTRECDPPSGYIADGTDCDDEDPGVFPGATEYCNGQDDDCDGDEADAIDPPTWYADADGDGFGDSATTIGACDQPDGYLPAGTDCDDTTSTINPGVTEVCADGLDNDCEPATVDTCTYGAGPEPVATLLGQDAYEWAGASVAGVGDVNGDGYDDLAIGAYGSGVDPDGVYIVTGPMSGTVGLAYADSFLTGTGADDAAGTDVAGAGDVDGDGYADVLVGAPAEASGGAAWLWSGPNVGYGDAASARLVVSGSQDGDLVGTAVAGPGDVDGDGIDDVLVGVPGLTGGAACLFSGTAEGALGLADADATFSGGEGEAAGSILASPGDVDGDGRADLAVLDTRSGTVWVEWGASFAGTLLLADAPAIVHAPAGGTLSSAAFVDVNGDEVLDVLVGELFAGDESVDAVAWGGYGPLVGSIDPGDIVVSSGGVYANAGVIVAAKESRGNPILVFAAPSASVPTDDGLLDLGGSLYVATDPPTSLSGATVRYSGLTAPVPAFAGDLDHDGFEDLVVGDLKDDRSGADAGAAHVYGGIGN